MCPTDPDLHAEDFYEILGLKSDATDKDIGAAYKRLALKYHPDKNPNGSKQAELMFKRITQAYDTLRDSAKRKSYDHIHGHASSRHSNLIPGKLGSVERAEELYQRFFNGNCGAGKSQSDKSHVHNIDIAGIFKFETKKKSESAHAPCKSTAPAHVVPVGKSIVIHGLTTKTEHNGKSATVRDWNAEKGRYQVALNCGFVISVRPQNITQLCHVQAVGHENQPEINGKYAEVVDFNEETGCYVLLFEDPALVIELPPKNCIFAVGTAAVLQDLSDKQLCGQMCSIVSIDHGSMRYVVQCDGGRQLKVRFEKVVC